MALNTKSLLVIAIPALSTLLGLFWFSRRKKRTIDNRPPREPGCGDSDEVTPSIVRAATHEYPPVRPPPPVAAYNAPVYEQTEHPNRNNSASDLVSEQTTPSSTEAELIMPQHVSFNESSPNLNLKDLKTTTCSNQNEITSSSPKSDTVCSESLDSKSNEEQENESQDSKSEDISGLKLTNDTKSSEEYCITKDSQNNDIAEQPCINGHDGQDTHSEHSEDSGQGNSIVAEPPSSDLTIYECNFPSDLCGLLIGKGGRQIANLKHKSGAEIYLRPKPKTRNRMQICTIEGRKKQVYKALDLLKKRFPKENFKPINVSSPGPQPPVESPLLSPELLQLSLPEGVSVDVVVSSVCDGNHVFVQQPTHPTYNSLDRLTHCMNVCYGTQDVIVPQLPRPIEVGVICAAPMFNSWYRAQVTAYYEDVDECEVRFVDYGGYLRVKGSFPRQIRSDFATLPFQATECYLANVAPPTDNGFEAEGITHLEQMVQGKLLQAQIVAREENGVPYIQLYLVSRETTLFINREMVNRGVAKWIEV